MNILTHTKQIKVHTLQLDDTEVEHYMDDPDAWRDLLSTLLTSKPAPNGEDERPRKKIARRKPRATHPEKLGETTACPKCGKIVKTRGLLIHQRGAQCRAASAPTT